MALLDLRSEFAAATQRLPADGGPRLIYLDSAATTLKPRRVVEKIQRHYEFESANVHRGLHYLSRMATESYEEARQTVARFLSAHTHEIVFTKGTTDAINLVATSYGDAFLNEGDTLVLTEMEHHSNIVPWQVLAERKKLHIKYLKVTPEGELDPQSADEIFQGPVAFLAITGISNTLGTINDLKTLIDRAHGLGAKVLVDGAQWVAHSPTDVRNLDCDFFAFSGHKCFGPTGVGVLFGKQELLEKMPPYQVGGGMIDEVLAEKSTYLPPPLRFEAGTPHIAGVLGLAEAIRFLEDIGWQELTSHYDALVEEGLAALIDFPGLELLGKARQRAPIFSFNLRGLHASDVSFLLDKYGVAVRSGHHCTQPLLRKFGVPATARASFSIYNDSEDLRVLISSLHKITEMSQ